MADTQQTPRHRRDVADSLDAIGGAVAWVDGLIAPTPLSADRRHDLQVCVEEALANLIMHGRARAGAKEIALEVEAMADGVVVSIKDACAPFDVTDEAGADEADEMRVGGRGLRLLRAFAGALDYRPGARNELRLSFFYEPADLSLIRSIPAFASADENVLAEMARAARTMDFAAGEGLLSQGEAGAFALILLTGEVAIVNESAHGEARVAQIKAPALVGEIAALAQLRRTASIRAVTPVRALAVDREALLEASRHMPDLLTSVVGQLGKQIQNINGALGLYAAGLSALQRDDFDPAVLDDLNNPTAELANFAQAFKELARRVAVERRTRAEMASAALIQRAMLPQAFDRAALAGRCDVFGDMKPARDVGGDLFDLSMVGADRVALVVGDVCGKGVPASLFMCATVTALRLAARQERDLVAIVEQANAALCEQNATSMFTTLFYGVLDLTTRRLDYVNCGHNAPYLLTRDACIELNAHGPPLGFYPDGKWVRQSVLLTPGEGVFLFTDGVTECANGDGEDFGETRLMARLQDRAGLDAAGLVKAVMAEAEAFSAGGEPFDDLTCVAALLPA